MSTETTAERIELTPFCSVEERRTQITEPWSVGDHTVASDGLLLVRVPRRDDVPDRGLAPNLDRVFAAAAPFENLRPLPEFELPPAKACRQCGGFGHIVACKECDGDGVIECCECGHERDCEDCRGKGVRYVEQGTEGAEVCTACRGAGAGYEHISIAFASGLLLAASLVVRMRQLPGLRINLGAIGGRPVPFVFEGGDGLVMPLSRLMDTHIEVARAEAAEKGEAAFEGV